MTLARALELREAIGGALQREGSAVELDLSDVTDLDSAGVQLLLSAKRTAAVQQRKLELVGQSAVVVEVLELLRLDSHFGGPAFFLFDAESP